MLASELSPGDSLYQLISNEQESEDLGVLVSELRQVDSGYLPSQTFSVRVFLHRSNTNEIHPSPLLCDKN